MIGLIEHYNGDCIFAIKLNWVMRVIGKKMLARKMEHKDRHRFQRKMVRWR